MKFIYCVLWCCISWTLPVYSMRRKIGVGKPTLTGTSSVVRSKIFRQKVDHFNPKDDRIWYQKFQVKGDHVPGAPIFLMLGGEGKISDAWMNSGAWIDFAKEFNALCIQLEHRYYGRSQPTENMSTDNLAYLSSEQALADTANFIREIREKYSYPSKKKVKVVTFGGSYAGSLSAWARMKYPHFVHAAVSSSGPLLAKTDFREYFEVVENSLRTYNPECVSQIKYANQMLNRRLKDGANEIEKKFRLCEPFDNTNKKNIATLFEGLADNIAGVVQYNEDNKNYSNSKRKSINIQKVCDIMVNKTIPTPLDRYAEVNSLLLDAYDEKCLDANYSSVLSNYYLNTTWNNGSFGARQWMYQTCTEFGFYQTSNQRSHIFGDHFPLQYFIDMCIDIFGKSFNLNHVSKAVDETNTMYGELDIRDGRIVYIHGSIDPWHALGVTNTKVQNTKAIFINGTAHCSDMYPSADSDSTELREARETIKKHLDLWLKEDDFIES